MTFLTGCASQAIDPADVPEKEAPSTSTSVSPFVGTWRWSGSGGKLGAIELGEEHMVFRADGTYTVVSKSGEGVPECYEGTFAWKPSANERRAGVMIFNARYERETFLDEDDTLHFGVAGTYIKSDVVINTRCPR